MLLTKYCDFDGSFSCLHAPVVVIFGGLVFNQFSVRRINSRLRAGIFEMNVLKKTCCFENSVMLECVMAILLFPLTVEGGAVWKHGVACGSLRRPCRMFGVSSLTGELQSKCKNTLQCYCCCYYLSSSSLSHYVLVIV